MFFKCKMCGGSLEFEPGDTIAVCDSCGTKQTLPRLDSDRRANLYDRANHFRRNNEFDKAAGIYEQILNEEPTDAEAYWSLVLCRYGIEYVEDPATHKRVPTINRTQFTSIYDDEDYKSALQHAGGYQRSLYEEEATTINDIQKGILAISQNEEPFDVFICYKETDANGRRTPDSVLANDIYHQLTQEGFKVFFARITLEDKLGTAYEPYIFAALNSAKVMVVLGTKPEYFNAAWVKNEWSRYLSLVNQSGGKKALIPAYRDMDPYDLPEEFSHLQAQDMSKLGFLQDLIRGIKKITKANEPKPMVKEKVVVSTSDAGVEPLLERAFLFLEDGNWQDANIYCEKVLDKDPKNAEAYLGKLMVEMKVRSRDQLADCPKPFNDNTNYSKILRFGDEKLATEMLGYIEHIKKRNENDRLIHIYNTALSNMKSACTESAYKDTANTFKTISGFKDADALAEQCLIEAEQCRIKSERLAEQKRIENERIENARLNDIYKSAVFTMKSACTESTYKEAVDIFKKIPGFRDADALAEQCLIEIEHLAEQKRIAVEKKNKKQSKVNAIILTILGACVIACIVNAIVQMQFVIPNRKYNSAVDLYNAGKYDEAITVFKEISGYKDSEEQIAKCETAIKDAKYERAMALIDSGDYEAAYALLNEIGNKEAVKSSKYDRAMALIDTGDYKSAYSLLADIGNYVAIAENKYDRAMASIDSGDYETAYILLNEIEYKDSASKRSSIKLQYQMTLLSKAKVGSYVYFGSYEQDNCTSNGKEDIEWLVLAKEDDRVLVISRYALDYQVFTNDPIALNVTWENCSLRAWLNGTFLNAAFSEDERTMIPSVTVSADKNPTYKTDPGNSTTDQVFLLSVTEAKEYFRKDEKRTCAPTAYAMNQGVVIWDYDFCSWWLRSPGDSPTSAACVSDDGFISNMSVHWTGFGVRPALWIKVGS